MEIAVQILVWLFMSIVGIALAAFVGGEGKALSSKHKDRTMLPAVRLLLVILIIWAITALALVYYQSKWYLLSIAITVAFFWICRNGNPIEGISLEENKSKLEPEQQQLNNKLELLVKGYEELLKIKVDRGHDFMSEDLLPAPRAEMAEALQFVYWFRLLQFTPAFTEEELLNRYGELTYFIKSDDASFMNDFAKKLNSKDKGNFAEMVELVKSNPDQFEANRTRTLKIYEDVQLERQLLWDAWDQAHEDKAED
jgi:hypothetical protein